MKSLLKIQQLYKKKIKSRKRYLDDCFIFWKYLWGNINDLITYSKNLDSKIKSTIEHRFAELSFLDIFI